MEDRYLFKAKRLDNGEWIIGQYVNCYYPNENNKAGHFILEFPNKYHEIYTSTICQCTGLRDKNGKLIWENDILDGFTYPYMSDGIHNYYAEVCWCSNVPAFGIYTHKYKTSKVRGISAGFTELMEDWKSDDWEIIGNIFDNPELLESEEREDE